MKLEIYNKQLDYKITIEDSKFIPRIGDTIITSAGDNEIREVRNVIFDYVYSVITVICY